MILEVMTSERPTTPPPLVATYQPGVLPRAPLTPEQVKRIEINRLRAKALREQREAELRGNNPPPLNRNPSNLAAGQKRPYSTLSSSNQPSPNLRDGRITAPSAPSTTARGARPLDQIQPARHMAKYVEYDFSKMTDTKGGFLTIEDDPHNKALHAPSQGAGEKPAHMTLKEWERLQLLRSLRDQKSGPFEPGLSVLNKGAPTQKTCRECKSLEIDWKWEEVFHCSVCNGCKERFPERYSLLTKTECREDYLLTDPELKDGELLPHLMKPNPHRAGWNNMMLYLRYQVEEYAFTKKWGSAEALDEEFVRREGDKKRRREDKFRSKLLELKKKTRVDAYRRNKGSLAPVSGGNFGDDIVRGGKHVHDWGRAVEGEDGVGVKTCVECGMEVEELEF